VQLSHVLGQVLTIVGELKCMDTRKVSMEIICATRNYQVGHNFKLIKTKHHQHSLIQRTTRSRHEVKAVACSI
jgi:hypothetical protein